MKSNIAIKNERTGNPVQKTELQKSVINCICRIRESIEIMDWIRNQNDFFLANPLIHFLFTTVIYRWNPGKAFEKFLFYVPAVLLFIMPYNTKWFEHPILWMKSWTMK